MQVSHVTETPDGTLEFRGELKGAELDAVVSVGLNYLLKMGVLADLTPRKEEDSLQ